MKKVFAWAKDNGGIVAIPIIVGLLGFLYGSIIFHWGNFYSKDVHAASGWWHLLGWVLTAGAVYQAVKMNERGSIILFGVTLALALCAFAGFSF
jgi:hypothetical protein